MSASAAAFLGELFCSPLAMQLKPHDKGEFLCLNDKMKIFAIIKIYLRKGDCFEKIFSAHQADGGFGHVS